MRYIAMIVEIDIFSTQECTELNEWVEEKTVMAQDDTYRLVACHGQLLAMLCKLNGCWLQIVQLSLDD